MKCNSMLLWVVLAFGSHFGHGAQLPFSFVMIDNETEVFHGKVPLDRSTIAEGIIRLNDAGAAGIILKFFFDLPSNEKSDAALERSLCATKSVLQAGLFIDGTNTLLNAKFLPKVSVPTTTLAGDLGYLPLDRFSKCAAQIGFVDFIDEDTIPFLEVYQGKGVKSLYLCALEISYQTDARFLNNQLVQLGEKKIKLNETGIRPGKFKIADPFEYIPLHAVLKDSDKSWRSKIKGTVVILGYDGDRIHKIPTRYGEIKAPRFFIYQLLNLADEVAKIESVSGLP